MGVCKWLQKLSSDHVIVSPLIYLYLLFSTFLKIRVFFTGIILLVVRLSKPSIIPLCKNVVDKFCDYKIPWSFWLVGTIWQWKLLCLNRCFFLPFQVVLLDYYCGCKLDGCGLWACQWIITEWILEGQRQVFLRYLW